MRVIALTPQPAGHAAPITHVALRSDGRRLATCSYDGTALVWDVTDPSSPTRLAELRHRRLVNGAAWNPVAADLLATASADKTVAIWRVADAGRPNLINVLARHTDDVNSVDWMPDGERLICVSEDGRATMWNALSGRFLAEVGMHTAHCMMVSVSRDGMIATVGEDGLVSVSDPDAGSLPLLRRYPASVEGCSWSRSGALLAVARDDGVLDLLDRQLREIRSIPVSRSAVRSVDWADDDSAVVVGAYDGALHVFDTEGSRVRRVDDARLWPRSVSSARGMIAAGSFWSSPHLFDFTTGAELTAPTVPTHGPNALAVAGGRLFIGCDSGAVFTVDVSEPAAPVHRLHLSDSPILSLAAAGSTLYAGTYSGRVIRHDNAGQVGVQLDAPVPSLLWTGDLLVAGTYNGDVIGLDPERLTITRHGAGHDGSVKSLACLDGAFLSASTDRIVRAGQLEKRHTVWEHGNLVNAVASLAGRVVATASRDHTVKAGLLTRDPDGTHRVSQLQTLLGPDESVKCVGLLGTPDAPVVLAGSYDFGLYTWRVDWTDGAATLASGRLLAEFRQGLSCMTPLGGDRLAVAGWDGRIMVVALDAGGEARVLWSTDVANLVARATARLVAAPR